MSWSQINRCLPKEPHPAHEHEESFSIWQWTIAAANLFQELWRQVHSSRLTFLFDSSRHKLPCDQDSGLPGMSGAPLSRLVPFPALTRLPTSGSFTRLVLAGPPACSYILCSRPTRLCRPRPAGCQDYEAQTALGCQSGRAAAPAGRLGWPFVFRPEWTLPPDKAEAVYSGE